jgi:hypothetical protein
LRKWHASAIEASINMNSATAFVENRKLAPGVTSTDSASFAIS